MNNGKHTPGEWAVQQQGPGCSISIIGPGQQSPFIAHVLPDEVGGETIAIANAALIAAAPDLLEAAKLVVAAGKAPNILISAIAKAEGRE